MKYSNKRAAIRSANGRFRKVTMGDFGFTPGDFADGKCRCEACGTWSIPILKTWSCVCGHKNGVSK